MKCLERGNLNMSEPRVTPILPVVAEESEPRQHGSEQYAHREFQRAIPFGDFIRRYPPSEIESGYVTSGLAAALTTNIDNPVFKLPTTQDERNGAIPAAFAMYAPYYIGTGLTPEQIANDVAVQAAAYLKALDAEHGYDGYVGRMLSVLRRGRIAHGGLQRIEDRNCLFDVHDFMATITNRLHHIAPLVIVRGRPYSAAEQYREDTHEKVDPYSSTVVYEVTPGGYNERFELPEFVRSDPSELIALGWDFFDSRALRRGAEFAALAAEKIGNPLVRGSLTAHYIPAYTRRGEYLRAAY